MVVETDTTSKLLRHRIVVPSGSPEAFETWREALSPMYLVDAADRNARHDYTVAIDGVLLGRLQMGSSTISASRFERSSRIVARSSMDSFNLMVYTEGSHILTIGKHEITVNAGDIVLNDMTAPHSIVATAFSNISILIPRDLVENILGATEALHGIVLRQGEPMHHLMYSHLLELKAVYGSLTIGQGLLLANATASLAAACFGPKAEGRELGMFGIAVANLNRIRRIVEANLSNPALNPEFLSQRCGISRTSLYRLFEPLGGISKYIQERRLARAFQDLTDPCKSHEMINMIAHRWGFSDPSSFNRIFRKTYQVSPSDVRARYGAINGDSKLMTLDPMISDFNALRQMLESNGHHAQ